jgi:hypothetical protein
MTTVYLHVGMPKCASSALQSFLHKNDASHRAEGLLYPIAIRETSGYFSHRPLHRLKHEDVPAEIDAIANEARKHSCNKIIISSEEFTNSLWDREITGHIVESLNTSFGTQNVRILALFRNHFPFVESVYAQFLKGGMFRTPDEKFINSKNSGVSAFCANFRNRNGFDFFSYGDFIERIRFHAPFNPLDLLSVERSDWDGEDIIDVLSHRFGITGSSATGSENQRYSETALYLLHYSRKKYGFTRTKQRRNIIAKTFPPSDRKFSKLLHVSGALFDMVAEASERDRRYFERNTNEPNENLFNTPDAYKMQRSQDNQLHVPDWNYHLVDLIMQPDEMSFRQATKIKISLEEN